MKLTWLGVVAAIVGVAGALVNLWARDAFPDQWGGPNIGGGFLQVLFYLLILGGVTLAVVGTILARRNKQHS